MGYSPGFLAKNGEFSTLANSPEIDTKQSRKELEIILEGFRRRLREFGKTIFAGLAKIDHVQNHGL